MPRASAAGARSATTTAPSHTDFGISRLEPGGTVPTHVHSFEESFHVTEGEVVLVDARGDGAPRRRRLRRHPGRRLRTRGTRATTAAAAGPTSSPAAAAGARLRHLPSPRHRARRRPSRSTRAIRARARSAAITTEQMNPGQAVAGAARPVSASMRTALLVYSGISLKMMVDSDLGAVLHTMFMVQYEPDGVAGPHDHPLEEAYLIIGRRGRRHLRRREVPHAAAATSRGPGSGCVHSFRATGAPVRWLETQSPQMPARHAYRFARDWEYLHRRPWQKNARTTMTERTIVVVGGTSGIGLEIAQRGRRTRRPGDPHRP